MNSQQNVKFSVVVKDTLGFLIEIYNNYICLINAYFFVKTTFGATSKQKFWKYSSQV